MEKRSELSIKEQILSYLPPKIITLFDGISDTAFAKTEEVRLRCGKPVFIVSSDRERVLEGYAPDLNDMRLIVELMCEHSVYAFADELSKGFVTLPGGHRAGVTGRTTVENGQVKTLRNISCINIRIAHQIIGAADDVMRYICDKKPLHTLIVSPPACGKTTILRDIVRQLSIGGSNVGLVDERSEIAGCYMGVPQNDIGPRTDVLDACPKAEGMVMLLRSMSPAVIAVDEIGSYKDVQAVENVANCGVTVICTAHGHNPRELENANIGVLIKNKLFKRYIVLNAPGAVGGIYDGALNPIMR